MPTVDDLIQCIHQIAVVSSVGVGIHVEPTDAEPNTLRVRAHNWSATIDARTGDIVAGDFVRLAGWLLAAWKLATDPPRCRACGAPYEPQPPSWNCIHLQTGCIWVCDQHSEAWIGRLRIALMREANGAPPATNH